MIYVGTVKYQVFSESESANNRQRKAAEGRNRLDIISEYIQESQNMNFTGKWALLVEWSDVHAFDHLSFFNSPSSFEGETAEFLSSVSQ